MRVPRDVAGTDLVKALGRLGYQRTRQVGSHIRPTRKTLGEQHLTVPDHNPIKIGTLNAILKEVAEQTGLDRNQLLSKMFG